MVVTLKLEQIRNERLAQHPKCSNSHQSFSALIHSKSLHENPVNGLSRNQAVAAKFDVPYAGAAAGAAVGRVQFAQPGLPFWPVFGLDSQGRSIVE